MDRICSLNRRRHCCSTSGDSLSVDHSERPQFFDDYYCESECEPLRGSAAVPMVDSEGSAPGRGVQLAFIVSPGRKKHVYAGKLSELLPVPYLSIESLVRQDLHPRSSLYEQVMPVEDYYRKQKKLLKFLSGNAPGKIRPGLLALNRDWLLDSPGIYLWTCIYF